METVADPFSTGTANNTEFFFIHFFYFSVSLSVEWDLQLMGYIGTFWLSLYITSAIEMTVRHGLSQALSPFLS